MDRIRRSQGNDAYRSLASVPPKPHRSTSYNHESGLVYNEVEVSGSSSQSNWVYDYRTPQIGRVRPRPHENTGARTLFHMALVKLGLESQNLTVDALQMLPWSIGERIWQQITQNHAESFYIWRTFAIAFGTEFADNSNRYMLDIKAPALSLPDYYKGLSSRKREWLTCLRISPKQVTVPDLVSLSAITNLSVLDLSDGRLYMENRESTFDIRIMRSWSELASTGRAFQSLEVFMLGWQEKVDTWIFDLLDSFPRLDILVMTDCRCIHHKNHKEWQDDAWKHGWTFMPSKRGAKHLRTLLDDKSFYAASASNLHYEHMRMAAEVAKRPMNSSISDRPLVECWLGTPKPWRHVIDEFPGTRTVFFQKLPTARVEPNASKRPLNDTTDAKRDPSRSDASHVELGQNTISSKRRTAKHSASSLLAEMS